MSTNELAETHVELMSEETARVVDELFQCFEADKREQLGVLAERVARIERDVVAIKRHLGLAA